MSTPGSDVTPDVRDTEAGNRDTSNRDTSNRDTMDGHTMDGHTMDTRDSDTAAVDQGIRYELRAMVSFPDVLTPLAATRPPARVALLDQDLAIVPVTDEVAAALHCSHVHPPPETGFRHLTAGVFAALRVVSMAGPVAYLEADYLGRDGRQAAAVLSEGAVVYGPAYLHPTEPFPADGRAPISEALARLGASPEGRDDEFVAVGLGRHRSTAAWYRAAADEEV